MPHGHVLAMHLRRAYLTMHRRFQAHFDPLGVTADQFVLLTLLAEEEGAAQKELVRRSYSDPNTIRAMLVLLENKGLIVRRRHATDGRSRLVFLTARGRKLQQELWRSAAALHQQLLGSLAEAERTALTASLDRIAQVMAPPAPRAERTGGTRD